MKYLVLSTTILVLQHATHPTATLESVSRYALRFTIFFCNNSGLKKSQPNVFLLGKVLICFLLSEDTFIYKNIVTLPIAAAMLNTTLTRLVFAGVGGGGVSATPKLLIW